MVNNSININKTSAITSNHWTPKTPQHMTLEIQVIAWNMHKNVAGLNLVMGSQPYPL